MKIRYLKAYILQTLALFVGSILLAVLIGLIDQHIFKIHKYVLQSLYMIVSGYLTFYYFTAVSRENNMSKFKFNCFIVLVSVFLSGCFSKPDLLIKNVAIENREGGNKSLVVYYDGKSLGNEDFDVTISVDVLLNGNQIKKISSSQKYKGNKYMEFAGLNRLCMQNRNYIITVELKSSVNETKLDNNASILTYNPANFKVLSAQKSIDSQKGGTIEVNVQNGATAILYISPNALKKNENITMESVAIENNFTDKDLEYFDILNPSIVIKLGPDGLIFDKPVYVDIVLPGNLKITNEKEIMVLSLNKYFGLEPVEVTEIKGNTVTVEINHFSELYYMGLGGSKPVPPITSELNYLWNSYKDDYMAMLACKALDFYRLRINSTPVQKADAIIDYFGRFSKVLKLRVDYSFEQYFKLLREAGKIDGKADKKRKCSWWTNKLTASFGTVMEKAIIVSFNTANKANYNKAKDGPNINHIAAAIINNDKQIFMYDVWYYAYSKRSITGREPGSIYDITGAKCRVTLADWLKSMNNEGFVVNSIDKYKVENALKVTFINKEVRGLLQGIKDNYVLNGNENNILNSMAQYVFTEVINTGKIPLEDLVISFLLNSKLIRKKVTETGNPVNTDSSGSKTDKSSGSKPINATDAAFLKFVEYKNLYESPGLSEKDREKAHDQMQVQYQIYHNELKRSGN